MRTLMQVWCNALQARYGEPYWPFVNALTGKVSLRSVGSYRQLLQAAFTMREFKIAPAAWAAFSIDVWQHHGDDRGAKPSKRRPPPVDWVWSDRRLVERRGWFRNELGRYNGGKVVFSELHKEIITRYRSLNLAVLRAEIPVDAPDAEARVAAMAEEFFPGGWLGWYRRAIAVHDKDRILLDQMVKNGDFLW